MDQHEVDQQEMDPQAMDQHEVHRPRPGRGQAVRGRTPSPRAYLAAAGAALAVFVISLGGVIPDGPDPRTATADDVREHLASVDGAWALLELSGAWGIVAGGVLTALLVGLVRRSLPGSVLADLVLIGGTLACLGTWVSTSAHGLWLIVEDPGAVPDATLTALHALGVWGEFFGDLGYAATGSFIGSFALAALRARLLPRPVAWTGLVVGAAGVVCHLGFVGLEVVAPLSFVVLFGGLLWPPTLAVAFLVRGLRSRRSARQDRSAGERAGAGTS